MNINWVTDEHRNEVRHLSSMQYMKEMIIQLETLFNEKFKTQRIEMPLASTDHLELDELKY